MCGIAGFISERPLNAVESRRLAKGLLFYAAERGNQSAGCYVDGRMYKNNVTPQKFINDPQFDALFTKPTRIVLCHTRMPTSGGKGQLQAQPFQQGNVATVHNGYYFDIAGIKQRWSLTKASGVDSELITDFISQYNIRMLPDFLNSTDGPSAIAAVVGQQLYLARTGNPLVYMHLKLGDGNRVTVFASTETILAPAIQYVYLLDMPETHMKDVDEGALFQVTPTRLKRVGNQKFAHQYPKVSGNWRGSSHFRDDYDFIGDDDSEWTMDIKTGAWVRKLPNHGPKLLKDSFEGNDGRRADNGYPHADYPEGWTEEDEDDVYSQIMRNTGGKQ